VTKAQDSFNPGSTSFKNKKRYLAFNMVGVVDVTDLETHHVINVEFHDKVARRGYHFQDHTKYSMASLGMRNFATLISGEQGVAYAAAAEDDQPSTIYYRPYDSWASASDWTMPLLPGEDATSIACGGSLEGIGSVIVATSKGFVRFFTSSGTQRYIWRIGEDVVTMAAGRDAVIIVHREGGTSLDGMLH
jgi:chromosome transmission fidelity protein 4